jgi:hypothetical protein
MIGLTHRRSARNKALYTISTKIVLSRRASGKAALRRQEVDSPKRTLLQALSAKLVRLA